MDFRTELRLLLPSPDPWIPRITKCAAAVLPLRVVRMRSSVRPVDKLGRSNSVLRAEPGEQGPGRSFLSEGAIV